MLRDIVVCLTAKILQSVGYLINYDIHVHIIEPGHEKTNNVVSEQVLHKLSCTSTEDDYRLEVFNLENRGIVLSVWRKQMR